LGYADFYVLDFNAFLVKKENTMEALFLWFQAMHHG